MLSKIKKLIPLPVKRSLFKAYSEYAPYSLGKIMGVAGYDVSRRTNFYSVLPTLPALRRNDARWNKPSSLTGLKYNIDEMKTELEGLLSEYLDEYSALPSYKEMHARAMGLGYTPVDSLTLYTMIRKLKPKRYFEVGSGLTTYYCSLAAEQNRKEGFPLEIVCVEPYPLKNLHTLPNIQIIQKEVQDVDLELFKQLEAGDVLFIDSSHVIRIDGDVPYIYLEIIPSVAKGVNIHIHDIPFPYNTPYPAEKWVYGQAEPMYWNEAMLLQAFLAFNNDFEIKLSLPMIRHFDEKFLRDRIAIYETVTENSNAFSSIWLKRVN